MKYLVFIWLIFACLFLSLSCFHWNIANKDFPLYKYSEIETNERNVGVGFAGAFSGENFVNNINVYIKEYNKASRSQNILTALGYLLAALTALASFFIELNKILSKRQVVSPFFSK